MAIRPELLRVDPANPPAWVLYAHATLLRATGYGDASLLSTWQAWAGATSNTFLEATPVIQSNAVIMSDGSNAIVSYEGTRNLPQLLLQIVGSGQSPWASYAGRASSFDLWCAVERNAGVMAALSDLPTGAGITLIGHSLGGAIAHVTANQQANAGPYAPLSLVTYGQPRTGDPAFCDGTATPYTRVTNAADPVPSIPPTYSVASAVLSSLSFGLAQWHYVHTSPSWIPVSGALVQNTDQTTTGQLEFDVAAALATGTAFNGEFVQNHYLGQYCYNLAEVLTNQTGFPDLTALAEMNAQLDQMDRITFGAPLPPLAVPSPGVFGSPSVVIPPGGGNPIIPSQQVGQTLELRGMTFSGVVSHQTGPILAGASSMAQFAKCTFFFQVGNQGWSESWWSNFITGGVSAVADSAYGLAQLRAGILGIGASINFMRISFYSAPLVFPPLPRSSKLFPLTPPLTSNVSVYGNVDVPENALLFNCTPTNPAPPKLVYFRGIPDNFIMGSPVPSGQPINWFGGPLTRLMKALTGGQWGWVGKNPAAAPVQITALAQILPGGTISITSAGTPFIGIPVGTIVPVRFSKLTTPGNLNGVRPCIVLGNNMCQTRKPIASLPWSGNGFLAYNGAAWQQVGAMTYQRVGERKVGRVFAPPRGRSRVRATA